MRNEESIVFALYFKSDYLNQKELILFFNEINNKLFGQKFDEISYTDNKQRDKSLKYNSKNIDKYLLEAKGSEIGFELSNYLDNYNYKSVDLKFSVCLNQDTDKQVLSSIYIVVNKKCFLEKNDYDGIHKLFIDISKFLIHEQFNLKYGLSFSVENEKFPLMFVAGIGNFSLTEIEENSIMYWRKNREHADKIIWDAFAGNLITPKHIRRGYSISDITNIVGDKNLFKLNEELYYFILPENSLKFGEQEKKTRSKLLKILNHSSN